MGSEDSGLSPLGPMQITVPGKAWLGNQTNLGWALLHLRLRTHHAHCTISAHRVWGGVLEARGEGWICSFPALWLWESYCVYLNFNFLYNKDDNVIYHRGNVMITGDNTYKRLNVVSDSHLCLKVAILQLMLDMGTFGRHTIHTMNSFSHWQNGG